MTNPGFNGLSNEAQVTRQAAGYMAQAASNARTIERQVEEAVTLLTGRAMVSLSGETFGGAVRQWLERFHAVITKLDYISQFVERTAGQFDANEKNNVQAPSSIIAGLGDVNL